MNQNYFLDKSLNDCNSMRWNLKSQFIKMPLYCSPWGRNSITIVYYLQLTLSSFIVNDIVKGRGTVLPLAILLLLTQYVSCYALT